MLKAGQVFESPRGTRVEILENSPERISFKRTLPPLTGGTKAKAHRHTAGVESFKVLSGKATGWVDGEERTVKAGEELEVPLGSTHVNPYTTAGETATLVQTVTPRPRAVEVYFTSWVDWLVQGKADANDEPTLMQLAAIIREGGRGGTWASGLPVVVQRIGLPVLGRVAGARGTRAVCVPVTAQEQTRAPVAVPAASPASKAVAPAVPSRNIDGEAIAITVFSTVKWWGRALLPVLFFVSKRVPKLTGTLVQLSFVHFARWSLVRKIPYNGAPQPTQKLRYPHMYFESNFNGGWDEYIDAFSHIMTSGMWAFWGSSFGFPKALPVGPFKHYIHENETVASHYYTAYPQATVTMITSALELDDKLAPLKRSAKRLDPDAFQAAYTKLLTDAQRCL